MVKEVSPIEKAKASPAIHSTAMRAGGDDVRYTNVEAPSGATVGHVVAFTMIQRKKVGKERRRKGAFSFVGVLDFPPESARSSKGSGLC